MVSSSDCGWWSVDSESLLQSVCSSHKILKAERFEQVVDGIYFESFHRIFGIGCGKDNERRCLERLYKVHAVEVGHVDVAEDSVNGFLIQKVTGLNGTLTLACQFKEGHLADVGHKLAKCQRFVVDG